MRWARVKRVVRRRAVSGEGVRGWAKECEGGAKEGGVGRGREGQSDEMSKCRVYKGKY